MIKPTMSHAVNKEHLNELLVEYYEKRTGELEAELFNLYYLEACQNGANHEKAEAYARKRVDSK